MRGLDTRIPEPYCPRNKKCEENKPTIDIVDFFDPNSPRHLIAFLHMESNGSWPEWWQDILKKNDVSFGSPAWKIGIQSKITDCWIKNKIRTGEYDDTVKGRYGGKVPP